MLYDMANLLVFSVLGAFAAGLPIFILYFLAAYWDAKQ